MNRSRSVVVNSNSHSNIRHDIDDEFGEVVVHHENREKFGVSPTPTRRKLMLQRNRAPATATTGTATSRRSRRCVTPEPQPRRPEQEATLHRRNAKKVESIPPPPPPPMTTTTHSKPEMRRPIHYPNSPVAMSKKRLSSLQAVAVAATELRSPSGAAVQPTRKRVSSIQSPPDANTYRSPSAVQVRKRATSARRRGDAESSNEIRQQQQEAAPQQQQKARDETKLKRRHRAKSVGPSAVTSYANDAIARKNSLSDHGCCSSDQDRSQTPSMVSLSSSSTSSSSASHTSSSSNNNSSNNEGFGRKERKKEGELSERAMKILMEHHVNDLPEWLRRRIEAKMRQASPQRVRPSSPSRRQQPPRLLLKTPTSTNNNSGTVVRNTSSSSIPISPLPF